MKESEILDRIAITVKSHKLLRILLKENPDFDEIMRHSRNETEALVGVREWIKKEYARHEEAFRHPAAGVATCCNRCRCCENEPREIGYYRQIKTATRPRWPNCHDELVVVSNCIFVPLSSSFEVRPPETRRHLSSGENERRLLNQISVCLSTTIFVIQANEIEIP